MAYGDNVYDFTQGHIGLGRNSILDFVLENRTALPDLHAEGLTFYDSHESSKRIKYCVNATTPTYVHIPRFDAAAGAESIANLVTFTRSGAPFAVSSNTQVDNLNANYVNGYSTSLTAVQGYLPVYSTGGTLFVGAPTDPSHAATKAYVDSVGQGLFLLDPCDCATTAAIANLSSVSVNMDGYTIIEGDLVLVKNGASPDGIIAVSNVYNGLFVAGPVSGGTTTLTRAPQADAGTELDAGAYTYVENGTVNRGSSWVQTTNNPTIGTSNIVFKKFFQAVAQNAGNGIDISSNTISVKINNLTTYTQGGIVYCGSTTTLSATGALTGILKANGTGAPTAVTGAANRVTFWSDANTISSSANLTWDGSIMAATGSITASGIVRASSSTGIVNSQGSYIAWNQSGGVGEMNLICHKGGGTGAHYFQITADGSSISTTAIMSPSILQFTGAYTVQNSSGILTLLGTGGTTITTASNTNILLAPNGLGNVQVSTDFGIYNRKDILIGNADLGTGLRWVIRFGTTAESGSNVGTDFEIIRRSDTGTNLGSALTITRSSGFLTCPGGGLFGSGVAIGATTGTSSNNWYTGNGNQILIWGNRYFASTVKANSANYSGEFSYDITSGSWTLKGTSAVQTVGATIANDQAIMTWMKSGNVLVGISTDNGYKFQIGKEGATTTLGSNAAAIYSRDSGEGNSWVFGNNILGVAAKADFGIANYSVSANPYLAIKANGNVLIGTVADAGYKLDVNGSFRATSIMVGADKGARKKVFVLGDGVATVFELPHGWNDEDVTVTYWAGSTKLEVPTKKHATDAANKLVATFKTAPASNSVKAVVVG